MKDTQQAIIPQDFCFMRQGQYLGALSAKDTSLLHPVIIRRKYSGRALLLIHGFASSPAVYREMIHSMSNYDAVFCPLLPGHGRSLKDFSETKASHWLKFIEQTFDDIAKDYDTIDVLGLSLGGLLTCHLAKNRQINHIYLLAPALALNYTAYLWMIKLLNKLGLKFIPNRGGGLLNEKQAELTFRKLPLACIQEIFQLVEKFEFVPFAQETTVFFGKYDDVIDNQKVQTILAALPHLSTVWLPHSSHVLPLDKDLPEILTKISST